jgi:hypothetical protein
VSGGKIVVSGLALVSGVVVEDLGDHLMVMVPGSTEVLTLSGDAATAVRRVLSGSPVVADAVVSDLVRLGVLENSGLSRRGLVKAGAIGAGAGIAVLAMPTAAMAASRSEGGSEEAGPEAEDNLVFAVNGADNQKLLIRIINPANPPETGIKATVSSDNPTVEYDLLFEDDNYDYYGDDYPKYSVDLGVGAPLDDFDAGTTITIFFSQGGVDYRGTEVLVSG